ncbi:MAG: FAD-dependent oxidoreductase [Aggregatilineales bacterium]
MPNASTQQWDIIIVGAGTAGIPCAITAAENGATVVVIEKANEIGGTIYISAGHMSGGGTRRQQERGIVDSPEDHFDDIIRISHDTADREIAWLAVQEAPYTLNWLDDLGFPFVEDTPKILHGHEAYSIARTVWGIDGANSILETLRPLWNKFVASGNITPLLEHEMTDLIIKDGAVLGIQAQQPDGNTVEIRAQAIVLTTGGYGANPKLFREITPNHPHLLTTAKATSTGDGILAAERIGGKVRNADLHIPSLGGIELSEGRADYNSVWAILSTASYRLPREIYVNIHGERFMAEDFESAHARESAVAAQPDHTFWLIFDDLARTNGDPLIRQWSHERLLEEFDQNDTFRKAETIAELANKTTLPEDALTATILHFNQSVIDQVDVNFGRQYLKHPILQPPFYGIRTRGTVLITFGGLQVDRQLRVLHNGGQPIQNLYAAGEAIGAGATCGKSFCGGMMVTPCLSFGRILGRTLAPKKESS